MWVKNGHFYHDVIMRWPLAAKQYLIHTWYATSGYEQMMDLCNSKL